MKLKLSLVALSLFIFLGFQNCHQFKTIDSSLGEFSANGGSSDMLSIGATIPEELNTLSAADSDGFGLKGDCKTDDTASLQLFFNKGGILKKPTGGCYLITDTILVPSNIQVQGEGDNFETLIKLQVPMNSTARPVLDFSGSGSRTTTNIHISKLAIDAGGDRMTKFPAKYNGNVGYGAGILVQSSNSSVKDTFVKNAWDTGIAFYQLGCTGNTALNKGQQCDGFPKDVTALRINCKNNGIGELAEFGGSCVGALTSQNTLVADSVDDGSAVGFHLDYGGSAHAVFRNLKTYNNHLHGYWIGSPYGYFENIEAHNTLNDHRLNHVNSGQGLILDRYASIYMPSTQYSQSGVIKNYKSFGTAKSGMVVAASGWKIENPEIISANQSNQNHSAILGVGDTQIISSYEIGVFNTHILNPKIGVLDSYPYQPDYGYDERIHEGSCISMVITGGNLKAKVAETSANVGKKLCPDLIDPLDDKKLEEIVRRAFLEILKREVGPGGLNYYVNFMKNGATEGFIRSELVASAEGQCVQTNGQFDILTKVCSCPFDKILEGKRCEKRVVDYEGIVKKAFIEILKREPLQAGLEYYVGLLNKGYTEQFIRSEIEASPESQCIKSGKKFVNGQCI